MHRLLILCLLTLVVGLLEAGRPPQAFDLILKGGRIADGTGNPWYAGDIGIRGRVIAEVGDLSGKATRSIKVDGLVVAPGFIDMMGGSSIPLLRDPVSAESKLRQGITTMLVGEGGSMAPQNEHTIRQAAEAGEGTVTWRTFSEYFKLLDEKGIALNVVHDVGAAQVRTIVMGDEDRVPTPDQLTQMKQLIEEAMQDGAVGVSTALIYPPGAYAKTEEIIELARVAAQYGGVYFSHMRNESNQLLEAIQEVIRIGQEAHIPVHIYHLKAAGQENWPLMSEALKLIQQARDQGVDVTADIYPYVRNGIGLGSFIHPRHYSAGPESFLATLNDPNVRKQLQREIETTANWENWYRHIGKNWDNALITQVGPHTDPKFVGLSIQGVAAARKVSPWQAFFDLVQDKEVSVAPKSMNEEQKYEALRAPFVSIDTDSPPVNPAVAASAHPRAFGTFPRVLANYVREKKIISLEEAIRKMTSLPANTLRLYHRGRISPGTAADLVVFDPRTIRDTATFTKPLSYAEGMQYVIVNGQVVIDDGKLTGATAGEVIRAER